MRNLLGIGVFCCTAICIAQPAAAQAKLAETVATIEKHKKEFLDAQAKLSAVTTADERAIAQEAADQARGRVALAVRGGADLLGLAEYLVDPGMLAVKS